MTDKKKTRRLEGAPAGYQTGTKQTVKDNRSDLTMINYISKRKDCQMEFKQNSKKNYYPGNRIKYVVYTLCRKCHSVNVPENQNYCSKCQKDIKPVDNYHPAKNANYRTKKQAAQCGALPWVYRERSSSKILCSLKYRDYEISIWKDINRTFCFYAGNKEKNVIRKHISELVFARTRSVRALAKIMGLTFDELVNQIKASVNTADKKTGDTDNAPQK